MREMNNEIKEKMTKAFKDFNNQLRIDTHRLQEIETQIRPIPDIQKKMKMLDSEMGAVRLSD